MENYLLGWGAYLLSALGLCVVFWRMTRGIRVKGMRACLRAFLVALLFTPINISDSDSWLAPAYLVGTYDWFLGNAELATKALSFVALAYAAMLGLVLLESLFRRIFNMDVA